MRQFQRIITVVLISLALFFLDKSGFFDSGFNLLNSFVVRPAANGFIFICEEGVFLFKNIFGMRGMMRENIFLKGERDFFREEYFKMLNAAAENEFLRQALSLEKEKGRTLVLGNILSFDPFLAEDSFLIDKGVQKGVGSSDAVILFGGILVGRIKEVGEKDSRVLLTTSAQSRVTVVSEDRKISGVVTGSASGALTLDLVLKEVELKPGQIMLTSGLDGVFPKGLLVGEVTRVYDDSLQSFQKAAVHPFFSLRDLKQVFVLVK